MSKEKHGTKENKKQALLNQKEKKQAKLLKKQEKSHPPRLIVR